MKKRNLNEKMCIPERYLSPLRNLLWGIALIFILAGCNGTYSPGEKEALDEEILRVSEIFLEGETSAEGEVTTRLYTNDEKYWGLNGKTLWTAWGDEGIGELFTERTVTMSKVKGHVTAGYGLVLCQGVREVEGREEETMLIVMINNNGEYAIGKSIGGQYEEMAWWTMNAAINAGLGAPNEILVRRDGNEFELIANGFFVTRFEDPEEPKHEGGRNGYIAVISPLDRLPKDEIDIYFTEKR